MSSPTRPENPATEPVPTPGEQTGEAGKQELLGRAHQLLGYLEGLHRLRHPKDLNAIPASIVLAPSLPDHPAVRLQPRDEVVLEVDRVDRPEPIAVPESVADRVVWTDVHRRPIWRRDPLTQPDGAGSDEVEADPARLAFDQWIEEEWQPWRDGIQPALDARALFLSLYDQRLAAERDLATHEVVWAHGIAVGQSSDGELVRLPLFVHPARYELDDRTGTLRVLTTGPARLEIDPFERLIDTFDLMKRIEAELTAIPDGLAESEEDQVGLDDHLEIDVLERMAKVIADARYVPVADTIPSPEKHWQFADIAGLYHRRRPVQYEAYFEALEQALADGYLPDTWSAILADEPTAAPVSQRIGSTENPWTSLDHRIFSPLPLNEQQRSVLTRVAGNAGATVQGPPGTGKSYAIAALTSHFLAHGLRVLICAEKPHPLRIIRQKMPLDLQQLCVAVLGDDRASNQQLEASIAAITAKVNAIDVERDQARLDETEAHLDTVRQRLADLRGTELDIRRAEQHRLTLDGTEWGVADAARHLTANPDDGWIVDEVGPDTPLPLSADELAELIGLTRQLEVDDRTDHGRALGAVDQLHSGAQLSQQWQRLDAAAATLDSVAADLDLPTIAQRGKEQLEADLGQVRQHRERVSWATGTQWAAIYRAMSVSEPQLRRWSQVIDQMTAEAEAAMSVGLELAAHQVEYPVEVDGHDPAPLLAELKQRFAAGHGLPRFGGGDLKQLVAAVSVDGQPPETLADLELVERARKRDEHRQRLVNLWTNELCPHGFPPLDGQRPEDLFQTTYQPSLAALIDLPSQSAALAQTIGPLFRRTPDLDHLERLDGAIQRLEGAMAHFQQQETTQWLERFTSHIARLATEGHPATRALHGALRERDATAWEEAATETRRLHQLAPDLDRQAELTARLTPVAPELAHQYRTETPTSGARQVEAAWRWRQLRSWIDEILGLGDLADVSARISETEREEQRLLTQVVAKRAWIQMARRTTGARRSALETWAQAMARIGKGTGKHAPRHRLTAQRAMRSAQNAVPVWIMSIAQAIDSFRPGRDEAFDVVIVDEASQAPLDSMAVLGLGQRVLVVGDDKQISPTTIIDQTEADRLRQLHLHDVPDADGFDIQTSLYDTASRRFPGVIQLREHFRCLPEIVAFSNELSYNGRIDPLRERHRDPDWEPVRAVAVPTGVRDGQVNLPEVDAVVELVGELLADPALGRGDDYPNGATIGVVSMIGRDQAKAIQSRLIEDIPVEEIEARRLRVGSPYEFQGDERDVIIVSMIDALDPDGRMTGQATSRKDAQQRYNVAASRARDQLIVVHSFDPAQLSETDLRRRLVSFAQHPTQRPKPAADLAGRCESRFERDILERLLELGPRIRVDAQYPVAGYSLDFTLTDPDGRRVAIECDGDSFRSDDQLRADTDRQRVLERLGWRFARIRASEFYADPDRSFRALMVRVSDHGVQVGDRAAASTG